MAINQEEIIGMLLPYVSINRVTLESSGLTRTEENPHIDSPLENPLPDNPSGLRIRLDLYLKDVVNDDAISTWFDQQDFAKYISLKIFQSVDPRITSVLSAGREMISLVDPDAGMNDSDARNKILMAALDVGNVGDARNILFRKTKYKKLSLKRDMLGSSSKLSQHGAKVDADGDKVFEINYSVNFELPEITPEHISYFAMTSLDVEALARDFGLDFQSTNLYRMNGNLVSEIVIDDYNIKSESTMYYTDDGKVWSGPIHKLKGQLRTGFEEASNSRDISKATVVNSVVQDFRVPAAIRSIPISFSSFSDPMLKTTIRNKDNKGVVRHESYFSDMFLTRDASSNGRFLFATNIRNLVLHKTVYGSLIKNMSPMAFQELLRDTRILSMKVWRKRIKRKDRFKKDLRSGLKTTLVDFDVNNYPPELVASTGEKVPGKLAKVGNGKSYIRESNLRAGNAAGVRFFTGMDKRIKQLNRGTYQYGVELEINDSSVRFFKRHLNSLKIAKKELVDYYNEAVTPTMSKYLAEVSNPHIDHPDEFAGTYGDTYGGWDPFLERFSQSFIRKMKKKYVDKRTQAPWIKSVTIYLNALNIFTNILATPGPRKKLLLSLGMYVNPKTATPKGISSVIKLIDDLSSKIEEILETTEKRSRHNTTSAQESLNLRSGKSTTRKIKILEYLYGSYEAESNNKPAWDYIGVSGKEIGKNDGLLKLSAAEWTGRVNAETAKHFNDIQADINMQGGDKTITTGDSISETSHGFLTPAIIHFAQDSVSLTEGMPDATIQPIESPPSESDKEEGKIDRNVKNISNFNISPAKKMTELRAKVLQQNSSTSAAGTGRPSLRAERTEDKDQISDSTTFNSMNGFLATTMNIVIEPATIEVKPHEDGTLGMNFVTPQDLTDIIAPCAGNIVDKVVDVGEGCASNKNNTVPVEVDEGGANVLFGTLINTLSVSGATNEEKKNQSGILRRSNAASSAKPKRRTTISRFSLSRLTSDGGSGYTGNGYQVTTAEISALPNQLKSLYLASAGSSVVKKSTKRLVSALTSPDGGAIKAGAQFTFNFGMISEVEFLAGFRKDITGETIVSEGVWKQLTEEGYKNFIGKEVLCRFKDYENKKLGIEKSKGMKNTMVNEFFILVPEKQKPSPPAPMLEGPEMPSVISKINEDFRTDFVRGVPGIPSKGASPASDSPSGGSIPSGRGMPPLNPLLSNIAATLGALDCETDEISSDDMQSNNSDDNEVDIPGINCIDSEQREILKEHKRQLGSKLIGEEAGIDVLVELLSNLTPGTDNHSFTAAEISRKQALRDQTNNELTAITEKLLLPQCGGEAIGLSFISANVSPDPCDEVTPASTDENNGGAVAGSFAGTPEESDNGERLLDLGGGILAGGLAGGTAGAGGGILAGGIIGGAAGAAIGFGLGAGTAAVVLLSDPETQEALDDCVNNPALCAEEVVDAAQDDVEEAVEEVGEAVGAVSNTIGNAVGTILGF